MDATIQHGKLVADDNDFYLLWLNIASNQEKFYVYTDFSEACQDIRRLIEDGFDADGIELYDISAERIRIVGEPKLEPNKLLSDAAHLVDWKKISNEMLKPEKKSLGSE
jgi:hypothetical protein